MVGRFSNAKKIHPRQMCMLLRNLDQKSLAIFSHHILDICENHMYIDRAVYLLGALDKKNLWNHRDKVLGLLQRRVSEDLSIDGAVHALQFFTNAGVQLAKEVLHELKFRDAMYTR